MAKTVLKLQHEIVIPGIGFHTTKNGTLMLKFTSGNIIRLRDALNLAAERLTEKAVQIVEDERQEEIRRMTPPPSPEKKHELRVAVARGVSRVPTNSQAIQPNGMARRIIEQTITDQPFNHDHFTTSENESKAQSILVPDQLDTRFESATERSDSSEAVQAQRVIISGGFEPDDGSLGTPQPTIR